VVLALVEDVELVVAAVSSDVMPWLIEMSCCKLFTPTSCVMYALGSVGCVGSWFFSSLTSNVRKSFEVMSLLDESVEDVELVELVSIAFTGDCVCCFGLRAEATVVAAAVPAPVIEFIWNTLLIFTSLVATFCVIPARSASFRRSRTLQATTVR